MLNFDIEKCLKIFFPCILDMIFQEKWFLCYILLTGPIYKTKICDVSIKK